MAFDGNVFIILIKLAQCLLYAVIINLQKSCFPIVRNMSYNFFSTKKVRVRIPRDSKVSNFVFLQQAIIIGNMECMRVRMHTSTCQAKFCKLQDSLILMINGV